MNMGSFGFLDRKEKGKKESEEQRFGYNITSANTRSSRGTIEASLTKLEPFVSDKGALFISQSGKPLLSRT